MSIDREDAVTAGMAQPDSKAQPVSAVRRFLKRVGASDEEYEAAELQASSRDEGATAVGSCECGEIVTVCGPLRSVTLHPVEGVVSVEAELYDGTGRVALVWLGRKSIGGIEPGRVLTASGRLNLTDGKRTIFNPRYTLRPQAAGE